MVLSIQPKTAAAYLKAPCGHNGVAGRRQATLAKGSLEPAHQVEMELQAPSWVLPRARLSRMCLLSCCLCIPCFLLFSAALCCSLLLSAVLCCSLLFSAVLCCSLLLSAALCCSLLLSAVLCCSLLLSAALCCSLPVPAKKSIPFWWNMMHLRSSLRFDEVGAKLNAVQRSSSHYAPHKTHP
jgi:hypothetical protein